jgi:hypothetical protein
MSEGFIWPYTKSSFNTLILILEQKTSSKSNCQVTSSEKEGKELDKILLSAQKTKESEGFHAGWMTFFLGKARLSNSKHTLQNSLKEVMKQQPTRSGQRPVKVNRSLGVQHCYAKEGFCWATDIKLPCLYSS